MLPILLTILLNSCGSVTTYRPSIYGHDYRSREIITPVTHERISCGDKDFQKYVSINLKDLSKLAVILKNAKLPKKIRIVIENFKKEYKVDVDTFIDGLNNEVKTIKKKQKEEL